MDSDIDPVLSVTQPTGSRPTHALLTTMSNIVTSVPAGPTKIATTSQSYRLAVSKASMYGDISVSTNPANGFHAQVVNHATAIQSHTTQAASAVPGVDLPQLPTWMMHVVAGTLSFLMVTAVFLLLAQFPPQLSWPSELAFPWTNTYEEIPQQDIGLDDQDIHHRSAAVASARDSSGRHVRPRRGSVRGRKTRNLSIDTRAQYRGLGIAVQGGETVPGPGWKRRSCEEGNVRGQQKSPVRRVREWFTAPLPSSNTFVDYRGTRGQTTDVEDGLCTAPPTALSSLDHLSPYRGAHTSDGAGEEGIAAKSPGSALFRKVNDGIYHVARQLSKVFHDHVTEAEEGLVLPVRSQEREKHPTAGS